MDNTVHNYLGERNVPFTFDEKNACLLHQKPVKSKRTVEFKVEVPGDFTLVDHSIFRINKGATGQLHVEGPENPEVLKKIQ